LRARIWIEKCTRPHPKVLGFNILPRCDPASYL
jgi:hypothetical protein